jgi:nucleotide-binding universal stress UspA family protein
LNQLAIFKGVGLERVAILQTTDFRDWVACLDSHGIDTSILTTPSLRADRILELAAETEASLIAVDLARSIPRAMKGLIRKLTAQATVPILIVNSQARMRKVYARSLFANVVLATDWSHKSEKALGYLLALKKILGQLDIIHIITRQLTIGDLRRLKKMLDVTRRIFLQQKIDAESHVYAGKAVEEILTAARDYKATLIVMSGRYETAGWPEKFKKNPSRVVARQAKQPVLLVP